MFRILRAARCVAAPAALVAFGVALADDGSALRQEGAKRVLAVSVENGVQREVFVEGAGALESASVEAPREPLISFIDNPNVTCVQPDPRKDECFVDFGYASVTASTSQYMIAMSFFLGGRAVASVSGFFQTSMYVPFDQFGRGFKVRCGPRQNPDAANPCSPTPCTDPKVMGNAYPFTVRARETGNLKAANFGTVTCPAFLGAKFYTLPPCRAVDTRKTPVGPLAGPALQPSATREFVLSAAACGVPAGAWGVSVNATVTGPTAAGFLTLFPGDAPRPLASTINFSPGQTRANNAVVPLASDFSGKIRVTNGSTAPVHFIVDVNGYFQ